MRHRLKAINNVSHRQNTVWSIKGKESNRLKKKRKERLLHRERRKKDREKRETENREGERDREIKNCTRYPTIRITTSTFCFKLKNLGFWVFIWRINWVLIMI